MAAEAEIGKWEFFGVALERFLCYFVHYKVGPEPIVINGVKSHPWVSLGCPFTPKKVEFWKTLLKELALLGAHLVAESAFGSSAEFETSFTYSQLVEVHFS